MVFTVKKKKKKVFPTRILCFLCDFRSIVLIQYVKMKELTVQSHMCSGCAENNDTKQGKVNSCKVKYNGKIKSSQKQPIIPQTPVPYGQAADGSEKSNHTEQKHHLARGGWEDTNM